MKINYLYKKSNDYYQKVLKLVFANDLVYKFHDSLEKLLSKKISKENFLQWLENNSTTLNINSLPPLRFSKIGNYIYGSESDSVEFIISNNNNINKLFPHYYVNVLQESKIKNLDNIPELFLFKIKKIIKEAPTFPSNFSLTPNMIKEYGFIYEALFNIFKKEEDVNLEDDYFKFIKNNINKINQLKNSFGKTPRLIGAGEDGVVYDIGPNVSNNKVFSGNRILKIFKKIDSYNAALEAKKNIHNNPLFAKTESNIHDIGILGEFKERPVYYYVMEKMETISEKSEESLLLSNLRIIIEEFLDENKDNTSDIKLYFKMLKNNSKELLPEHATIIKNNLNIIVNNICSIIKETYPDDILNQFKNKLNLKNNWLELYVEEHCLKYLTGKVDLHTGNIGISNGQLKFFDPVFVEFD